MVSIVLAPLRTNTLKSFTLAPWRNGMDRCPVHTEILVKQNREAPHPPGNQKHCCSDNVSRLRMLETFIMEDRGCEKIQTFLFPSSLFLKNKLRAESKRHLGLQGI